MSSWLRSAVNKAVEVGNKNNLTRTVRTYADSVVQHAGQAVAEGAKIIQDRIAARNFRSVSQTVKRLEEAAVSNRGPERAELLRRWLAVLKEIEFLSAGSADEKEKTLEQQPSYDEARENARKSSMVLYYDGDTGGQPLNFCDVFLQSQALEGMALSMILEGPNEEEVSLLLEMFGFCLTGGKEVHNAIVSSIQDLATSFSIYHDEVLVKREELLQFAQGAITGLKVNADLGRIDTEALNLKKKLEEMNVSQSTLNKGNLSECDPSIATVEALKEALARIRICSRIEGLLLKKKFLTNGDSPEIHAQKVDKLKVLAESLANSSAKAEKRIADNRLQKEEALKVRVAKAGGTTEKEKELEAEIAELERQRKELESQLKKINILLLAAQARLCDARDERNQFEEANNQIVEHLKTKEDELSKSIASCKAEAEVLHTWINFLEDAWVLQRSYAETNEKQVNDELEKHEDYFVNLVTPLLVSYKKELEPCVSRIQNYVENLKYLSQGSETASSVSTEDSKMLNPRKNLEEEYLAYESKIIATFSVVDNIKEQFYTQKGKTSRKDDTRITELLDDMYKLREQFDSVERPELEMENPVRHDDASSTESTETTVVRRPVQDGGPLKERTDEKVVSQQIKTQRASGPVKTLKSEKQPKSSPVKTGKGMDPAAELAKLESEFGKVGQNYSTEEIGDWEFDELERELIAGDSEPGK